MNQLELVLYGALAFVILGGIYAIFFDKDARFADRNEKGSSGIDCWLGDSSGGDGGDGD